MDDDVDGNRNVYLDELVLYISKEEDDWDSNTLVDSNTYHITTYNIHTYGRYTFHSDTYDSVDYTFLSWCGHCASVHGGYHIYAVPEGDCGNQRSGSDEFGDDGESHSDYAGQDSSIY